LSLVIEKGYARVSVNDITERAGIDRTTFYLHFKDKDDLFEKSERWIVDELIALRSRGSGPFPGVSPTCEHMARNSEKYLAIFRSENAASRTGTQAGASSMESIRLWGISRGCSAISVMRLRNRWGALGDEGL
jgi:AcrR family transcriptional regulator